MHAWMPGTPPPAVATAAAASTQNGGPVHRPWELAEREERERDEREERERLERMQRAGIPPPRRDDPDGTYERYGRIARNPKGNEAFRKDRRVWYEHVTGESLEGVSLTKQWELTLMCSRVPGGCTATDGSESSDRGQSVWSAGATRASASGRRRTRRCSTRTMIIRCVCDTLSTTVQSTVYCLRRFTWLLARAAHAGCASSLILIIVCGIRYFLITLKLY